LMPGNVTTTLINLIKLKQKLLYTFFGTLYSQQQQLKQKWDKAPTKIFSCLRFLLKVFNEKDTFFINNTYFYIMLVS